MRVYQYMVGFKFIPISKTTMEAMLEYFPISMKLGMNDIIVYPKNTFNKRMSKKMQEKILESRLRQKRLKIYI